MVSAKGLTGKAHLGALAFYSFMHHTARVELDISAQTAAATAKTEARRLALSQVLIAAACGLSQSQVSRALAGDPRAGKRAHQVVCTYVHDVARERRGERTVSPVLQQAVAEVWDGTPRHAQALAMVIRSLAALAPPDVSQSVRRK